jgi:hypothetical protein
MKGTSLLDINNKEFFVSRHTNHHEHIFPYQHVSSPSTWNYYTNHQINTDSTDNISKSVDSHDLELPTITPISGTPILDNTSNDLQIQNNPSHSSENPQNTNTNYRPIRQKTTPSYLADYVCNTSSTNHAEAISLGILYPIAYFHSFIICLLDKSLLPCLSLKVLSLEPVKKHVSMIIG